MIHAHCSKENPYRDSLSDSTHNTKKHWTSMFRVFTFLIYSNVFNPHLISLVFGYSGVLERRLISYQFCLITMWKNTSYSQIEITNLKISHRGSSGSLYDICIHFIMRTTILSLFPFVDIVDISSTTIFLLLKLHICHSCYPLIPWFTVPSIIYLLLINALH